MAQDNSFSTSKKYQKEMKRWWWLMLLIGIALVIIGVIIFMYPVEMYLSFAILFGFLILAAGIIQIVIASSDTGYISGRGWMLAAGIIEVILGLILAFNIYLSALTLPIFLGFWLLFRGFLFIGFGSDMRASKIEGSGWTIVTGILLLLCSIMVLMHPFYFGVAAVVIWVGISFLAAGISTFIFAWQLRGIHKRLS